MKEVCIVWKSDWFAESVFERMEGVFISKEKALDYVFEKTGKREDFTSFDDHEENNGFTMRLYVGGPYEVKGV
jgi:hypothetical protein